MGSRTIERGAAALGLTAAAVGALALAPAQVTAQVGGISIAAVAAASGTNTGGGDGFVGTPIFSESGYVLPEGWAGNVSVSALGFAGMVNDGLTTLDWELSQTSMNLGAYAAVGSRGMVGVAVPYVTAESTVDGVTVGEGSGLGDLTLFGKAQLANSADGRTTFGASAAVSLGTGSEEVSSGETAFGVTGAVSHQLDGQTSLHGSLGVSTQTAEEGDAPTNLDVTVAGVRRVSEKAWVSGELLTTRISQGGFSGTVVNLAPGVRFLAGEGVFVDIGAAINLSAPDGSLPLDYAFAVGLTYFPGAR